LQLRRLGKMNDQSYTRSKVLDNSRNVRPPRGKQVMKADPDFQVPRSYHTLLSAAQDG
jgi:hypothetical protein